MVMTRANVVSLADNLTHSKGDTTTLTDSFDRVLDRLGRSTYPFIASATFSPTDGTSEYSYPSTAIELLAVIQPTDDNAVPATRDLPSATLAELEAYDEEWRGASEDEPIVQTFIEKDVRKVRLWPTPDTTRTDKGLFIYSENRTTDIPVWLALPIVCEMIAEEFEHQSDHQDKEAAEAWKLLATILKAYVGI